MTIKIILKNGATIPVKCESFKHKVNNITGEIASYEIEAITENKPIYIDLKDISAIVRVYSDENWEGEK